MPGKFTKENTYVSAAYNAHLIATPDEAAKVGDLETYIERLCSFITAEIAAGRMFWSYELPSDNTMRGWYLKYRKQIGGVSKKKKKSAQS